MKKSYIYLILLFSALSWSSLFIFIKLLNGINSYNIAFFRFAFGLICFLPIYLLIKKKNKIKAFSRNFFIVVILVAFNGICTFLVILANKYANASINTVFFSLNPLFVALLAPVLIKEKNRLLNYLGIILALIGVILIVTEGGKIINFWQIKTFYSLLLGLGDGILIGVSTNYIKKYINLYNPWTIAYYSMWVNTVILLVFTLIVGGYHDLYLYSLKQWLWLFLLGALPTGFAFATFYYGVQIIGATKAAAFKLLMPFFGVILAVLLLKELLSWYIIVGGLITISGLYLTQKK